MMNTNELISILSQTPPPKAPCRITVLAGGILLLSALFTFVLLGVRPELQGGHVPLSFWMKSVLLTLNVLVCIQELDRVSRPQPRAQQPWLWRLLVSFVFICLGIEWLTVDASTILHGFLLPNFPECLVAVSVYGSAGLLGMNWLLKFYAPADTRQCASVAGLTAAAAGAVGYSIHCPLDSPTFIVVAYGIPILILGWVGRRFLTKKIAW
ncbi:NrsF family protein [uncultured Tolumonas sp.]|uniref:NrsF family protein n=1 Tax=uncultured Tolumonas sp. TaxID=263765 RepID=UPI002A0A645F|nr:NrsF family protein [uncultured Tolumonas sp.]